MHSRHGNENWSILISVLATRVVNCVENEASRDGKRVKCTAQIPVPFSLLGFPLIEVHDGVAFF